MLTVEARVIGRRRPLIPRWSVPLPPTRSGRGEPLTLRELITQIVVEEVIRFRQRQSERTLIQILTEEEIEEQLVHGRVVPGPRDLSAPTRVDEDEAVGTSLQAFEDGLYLVFIDGLEHKDLDEQVFPGPDSAVTFVRLVALAGA